MATLEPYVKEPGIGVRSLHTGQVKGEANESDTVTDLHSFRSPTLATMDSSTNGIEQRLAEIGHATWVGDWITTANVAAHMGGLVTEAAGKPFITVLYAIPNRDDGLYSAGGFANREEYLAWIEQCRAGVGNAKVWWVLEPDALPSAMNSGWTIAAREERQETIRLAVNILKQNVNARVYIDAGNATWRSPQDMADLLIPAGISVAEGFSCNVSNFITTSDSAVWADLLVEDLANNGVSSKKYLVDSSRNGKGPLPTDYPGASAWFVIQADGSDRKWANPPGRGAGLAPQQIDGHLNGQTFYGKIIGESDGQFPDVAANQTIFPAPAPAPGTWWTPWWNNFVANTDPALIGAVVEPPTEPPSDLPSMNVMSGDKFHDTWGTRIFPSYTGKSGGALITNSGRAFVTELDPAFVTHKITTGENAAVLNTVTQLGNAGVKSVFTVGEPHKTYTTAQWNEMMTSISSVQDHLFEVNGQNEINHVRGGGVLPSNWAQTATSHQQTLWNRMTTLNNTRASNGKSRILIGNANLWSGDLTQHNNDLATVGPMMKPYSDCINFHLYPRGDNPDWNLDDFITRYKNVYGAKPGGGARPVFCTEGGYFEADNYTGGAKVVTNWAHNIYLQKQWLEYAWRWRNSSPDIGPFISQFEFLDDYDPNDSNREASFGLIDVGSPADDTRTWDRKAAFHTLKAMATLRGGTSGTFPCKVEVTGSAQVRTLAVRHAGGIKMYLWRPVNIETNRVKATLNPANVSVKITTTKGSQTVSIAHAAVEVNL